MARSTIWNKTTFAGIRYREHPNRKHGVRKDRYFTIRFQQNGKRIEESLGWASEGITAEKAYLRLAELKQAVRTGEGPQTLREKREIAARERREAEELRAQAEREKITYSTVFALHYAPVAKANKKKSTWQAEEVLHRLWIEPVIGDKPMAEVAPIDLERIKSTMSSAGRAPRTIDYALAVVRQTYHFAQKHGHYQGPYPGQFVRVKRTDNRRQRYLKPDEIARLLETLSKRSPQLHDIAVLSLNTGMRASEVFALTWGDVDFQNGFLALKDTKSGRNRHVPLNAAALTVLKQNHLDQQRTELIFPSRRGTKITSVSNLFDKIVTDLGFNAGITDPRDKCVFHTLRHSFASLLVSSGSDLYVVKELLGHSTLKMTERYSHLRPGALKKAVESLDLLIPEENTPSQITEAQVVGLLKNK